MEITHYDLFAGIGGFSLALDEVFREADIRHVFCEWEKFPTAILRRHWPEGEFWGDIADLVAHTAGTRAAVAGQLRRDGFTVVTGGFPCQPFSQAGRRRGTADDRYKWPEMFAVIRHVRPRWVVAENVRGLVTWNGGLVLERLCADLEGEGYEVQPLVVPAVAVGAPHRRDRVWVVGHAEHHGRHGAEDGEGARQGSDGGPAGARQLEQPARPDRLRPGDAEAVAEAVGQRLEAARSGQQAGRRGERAGHRNGWPDWNRPWRDVALERCVRGLDDGLPRRLGGIAISHARWRAEGLKALGNAIVPQIATRIFQAIKDAETGGGRGR